MPYKLMKKGGKLMLKKGEHVLAKDTTITRAKKQIQAIETEKHSGKKINKQCHKDMGGYNYQHPAMAIKHLMN